MKKLLILGLAITVLFSTGCSAGYINSTTGDTISPIQDSTVSKSAQMPLYFRYYDEDMLIRCPINISITPQEQPEFYAISALLTESVGQRPDVTYCFNGKTKLIKVTSDGDYLYVTLSDDFYDDTKGDTDESTRKNRALAIYSIVNTVCEMGNHSYVQIYIDVDGSVLRPDSYEMGLSKSPTDSAPLGPLSRNTALLLTPSNVAKAALSHYSNLEWDKLYLYLAQKGNASMPTLEELSERLNYLNLMMSSFSVEDNYTVSADGNTALVQVSFKIRTQNASYDVQNVPLTLIYKGRSWLVDYESLMLRLGVDL